MSPRFRLILAALSILAVVGVSMVWQMGRGTTGVTHPGGVFREMPVPVRDFDLFDLGVAEINGDKLLDIYGSNHSSYQSILFNQGNGRFSDHGIETGLSQDRQFPQIEDSLDKPVKTLPGLYLYRSDRLFYVDAHDLDPAIPVGGSIQLPWPVEIISGTDETIVRTDETADGAVITSIAFELRGSEDLVFIGRDEIVEVPHHVVIETPHDPASIFIGLSRLNPTDSAFTLHWRDRHGFAWADMDNDGSTDVFVARGGIKGSLDRFGQPVFDEFFKQVNGRFVDGIAGAGIDKGNCPGRQVAWVDYDVDGDLDLYLSCGRGDELAFPNKLYRQDGNLHFTEIGGDVGLDYASQSVFAWLDGDSDGIPELVSAELDGVYLYQNGGEVFAKLRIPGDAPYTRPYRLAVADFDNDGDLDVYLVHRRNSLVIRNEQGSFSLEDPTEIGLPASSAAAGWVDADNDGLLDLHVLPSGLYRQKADGTFQSTGDAAAAVPTDTVISARSSWFDANNDGLTDAVIAVQTNAGIVERAFAKIRGERPDNRDRWSSALLLNTTHSDNNWLQLRVKGPEGNRDSIGSQVSIQAAGRRQFREVGHDDGAQFGQGHYRLYFGVGDADVVESISIRWPDGTAQIVSNVAINQLLEINYDATTP